MKSSLAISAAAHGLVLLALVYAPNTHMPRRTPSEYEQKIAGRESKLVWYKFRRELPEVKPEHPAPDVRPLRAEARAKQAVVSSPRNAPPRERMVWMPPAPELKPVPLEQSPNLLAIKLPALPPPPAKAFVQPPTPARRVSARVEMAAEAPLLPTEQTRAAHLPSAKLPPKPYVAPPASPRVLARVNPLAEAPRLDATLLAPDNLPSAKLPPRPFTAPANGHGPATSKSVSVEAPPIDSPANSRDLNLAVVGLNPSDRPAPLPPAPSPARFSAGPVVRADGASPEGAGKGLNVPDLFVRGAHPNQQDPKPDLIAQAYAAPTSSDNLRAAISRGEPVMTVHLDASVSPTPGAAKVSSAPDPRFNGRDVYMMAIQMPNLTSYSGSWLMWYSGRTARETGLAPIAAPVPHRKVDPKYIATAAEERIEGRVRLACIIDRTGHVSGVELVHGIDDRLNRSAGEALAKWEFYPALRNGQPVDVDVLVEIPFHLAPRAARR